MKNNKMYKELEDYLGMNDEIKKRDDKDKIVRRLVGFLICAMLTAMFGIGVASNNSGIYNIDDFLAFGILFLITGIVCFIEIFRLMLAISEYFEKTLTEQGEKARQIIENDGLEIVYHDFENSEDAKDIYAKYGEKYVFIRSEGLARREDIREIVIKQPEGGANNVVEVVLYISSSVGKYHLTASKLSGTMDESERDAAAIKIKDEIVWFMNRT